MPQRPTDLHGLRARNQERVLRLLWQERELARAELARRTGLARSTISTIVQGLLDLGLVHESHRAASSGGRPATLLRFDDDRVLVAGLDMGATHLTVVVTNLRGRVLVRQDMEFDVSNQPRAALGAIERMVKRSIRQIEGEGTVIGLGSSVPCPVDPEDPNRLSQRILPAWAGVEFGAELRARTGLPVWIDNDANLGALAELRWGAGRGVEDFAWIKVATGVGAGLIIHGRIYGGAAGIAGEIGHTAVDPNGPICRCGLPGCLETMVGAPALEKRVADRIEAGEACELNEETVNLRAIVAAAVDGDPLCTSVLTEAGHHLGIAVANLLNLINPSRVVLGGTLSEAGEILLKPLRQAINERTLSSSAALAEVRSSPLNDASVALGGATLVIDALLTSPERFLPAVDAAGADAHSTPRSLHAN